MFSGKTLLITGGTGTFGNAVLGRFLDTEGGQQSNLRMIEGAKEKVKNGDYWLTVHAFERCVERNISPGELKDVMLLSGVRS